MGIYSRLSDLPESCSSCPYSYPAEIGFEYECSRADYSNQLVDFVTEYSDKRAPWCDLQYVDDNFMMRVMTLYRKGITEKDIRSDGVFSDTSNKNNVIDELVYQCLSEDGYV